MKESVLEASWRLKRKCHIVYTVAEESVDPRGYHRTSHVECVGIITELHLGEVTIHTMLGDARRIPIPHIVLIDKRNPLEPDSPEAPAPPDERTVHYRETTQDYTPVYQAYGKVLQSEDGSKIFVERRDGTTVEIPAQQVVKIE